MSDMLQTNRDLSPIDANEAVDAAIFQPLFQEEDGSSQLVLPRKRHPVRLIVISIVLLLLLIGGGVYIYLGRAHASVVLYTTVPTSIGNLTETVSASGPLQAKAEYDMNFSSSGQVSAIDVHVGQQVKAGQVLATMIAP